MTITARGVVLALAILSPAPAQEVVLFAGGTIWTADSEQPSAGAVVVVGERIAFVGELAAARARAGESARIIDLAGKRAQEIQAAVHALLI